MYVADWMLNSGYGMKCFIDYDGNHGDDNDESHSDN